jgi:AraC-like DNA-binding protein
VSFNLEYLAPPRAMMDIVSAFYLFETDEDVFDELERADVAQLRFVIAGTGHIAFGTGEQEPIHPVSVYGPRTMASRVIARGPVKVFGCGLSVAGWAGIVGQDASQYANRISDANRLISTYVQALTPKILAADNIEQMSAVFEANHAAQKVDMRDVPLWFIRLVDDWLQSDLNPSIDHLVAKAGMGRSKVESMMKQFYGAPPKTIARKYRALRTASLIAQGVGDWQDYAAEAYSDQSHFIRDMKEFVGITPSAIRHSEHRLLGLTFGRAELEGKIAPLSAQT